MSRCHARYSPSQRCELDAHGDEKEHAIIITWPDEASWSPEDMVAAAPVRNLLAEGLGIESPRTLHDALDEVFAERPVAPDRPADTVKDSELGTPITRGDGPPPRPPATGPCVACRHPKTAHSGGACNGRTSDSGESFACGCLGHVA